MLVLVIWLPTNSILRYFETHDFLNRRNQSLEPEMAATQSFQASMFGFAM